MDTTLYNGKSIKINRNYISYQVFNYELEDVEEINDKKRFEATFTDGTKTKFGQIDGSTFIDHKDEEKKTNYIKRHERDLRTLNPKRAGYLSMFILWNKSLSASIKDYNRRLKENDWSLPN